MGRERGSRGFVWWRWAINWSLFLELVGIVSVGGPLRLYQLQRIPWRRPWPIVILSRPRVRRIVIQAENKRRNDAGES